METSPVRLEISDGVARVILNRPDKRNAVSEALLNALDASFAKLTGDKSVRAVVLRGDGPVFCSGIDFNYIAGLTQFPEDDRALHLRELIHRIQSVMHRMERLEKPILALMHGAAAGLGLEIAMAADFRVATSSCRLGLPEVLLGLIPDCGGTTRITRLCGTAVAKEIVMLGELITADRALSVGLLNAVVPDDSLDSAEKEWTAKLLDRPPLAMGLAKRAITWGAGVDSMTHMEIEAYVQSIIVSNKNFTPALMEGIARLRKK